MGHYAGLPHALEAWLQELINIQTYYCLVWGNISFLHDDLFFCSSITHNLSSMPHKNLCVNYYSAFAVGPEGGKTHLLAHPEYWIMTRWFMVKSEFHCSDSADKRSLQNLPSFIPARSGRWCRDAMQTYLPGNSCSDAARWHSAASGVNEMYELELQFGGNSCDANCCVLIILLETWLQHFITDAAALNCCLCHHVLTA